MIQIKKSEIDILKICRSGGMADTTDLKSVASDGVRVRVPPSIPNFARLV